MKELSYHCEICLWLISAPKDTIKTSMDMFGCFGQKLTRPNMSCVTCHTSCFTCNVSHVFFKYFFYYFFYKVGKLIGGGSVIKVAYPI